MGKILDAQCENQTVTVEGFEITEAEILSQGDGASEGVLFVEEGKSRYHASNAPDLNTTLEKIAEALQNVADALNGLDTAGYIIAVSGGSGAPAVGTPATPMVQSEIATIESLKDDLETLRGNLR